MRRMSKTGWFNNDIEELPNLISIAIKSKTPKIQGKKEDTIIQILIFTVYFLCSKY